jgi:hypothetical protein
MLFAVDGILEAGVGRLNESSAVYGTNSGRSIDSRTLRLDKLCNFQYGGTSGALR